MFDTWGAILEHDKRIFSEYRKKIEETQSA